LPRISRVQRSFELGGAARDRGVRHRPAARPPGIPDHWEQHINLVDICASARQPSKRVRRSTGADNNDVG
jgi:hypothetical protein